MPGPPPKDKSLHRKRTAGPGMRQLPAEGRPGEPPQWPIGSPTGDEVAVWAELWALPQAVEWERLGWTRTVARYVRLLVEAEQPDADTTLRAETRQLEDRLGLTPMAMLRLRWDVGDPEKGTEVGTEPVVTEKPAEKPKLVVK